MLDSMERTFKVALELATKKNRDYAGIGDPFHNFKNAEVVGVPVERGIMVRMMDKMARISQLLDNEAEVKDESIYDTITDLINYAAILKAYREQK